MGGILREPKEPKRVRGDWENCLGGLDKYLFDLRFCMRNGFRRDFMEIQRISRNEADSKVIE